MGYFYKNDWHRTKDIHWPSFSTLASFVPTKPLDPDMKSHQVELFPKWVFHPFPRALWIKSQQATSHWLKGFTHFISSPVGVTIFVPQRKIQTLREGPSPSSSMAIMGVYTENSFEEQRKHVLSCILKEVCKLRTLHIPILQRKKLRPRELCDVPAPNASHTHLQSLWSPLLRFLAISGVKIR